MIFRPVRLAGAWIIDLDKHEDERGFFARAWCATEFEAHGLPTRMVQANLSYNRRRGTLRGMHYQAAPHPEAKVIRCIRGALYDVLVDIRPGSPTFAQWVGAELTAENRTMLYIPEGCAHGFQTLTEDTEALYLMSAFYVPGAARGFRYDDPAFRITWPLPVSLISDKDSSWPPYDLDARGAAATRKA